MNRKRIFWVLTAFIAIVLTIMILSANNNLKQSMAKVERLTVINPDLTKVADGTYTGSYESVLVSAEVKVTVKGHKITHIELVRHDNGKGEGAEIIPKEVVNTQSLDVDLVSGATYSSKVILKSIEKALS